MTGTIVRLAGSTRTGMIRSEDGSRLMFTAAGVLGEFETLAVGHLVSFDVDRAHTHLTAVRVFREPMGANGMSKKPDAPPDLRYAGFNQSQNIRSYRFDAIARGRPVRHFVVTVDVTLMQKLRIGVQEAPALCLRKLAADLKAVPDAERHELGNDDLLAYASSRDAAVQRKRPKHSFAGRRGAPPPGPANHVRAT